MAKAATKRKMLAQGPLSHEVIRARECERAGITLEQFTDFASENTQVRAVQDRVIWRVHKELAGMTAEKIDTWLRCAPKRVADALRQEPPVPAVGTRVSVVVQTDDTRKAKIEKVIGTAATCFHSNEEQFKSRKGLPQADAAIGSILLVLEFWGVASFHAVEQLGCTDAQAQEVLRGARESLYDSISQLYHHTHDLCVALDIKFEDLQKACT